MSAYMPIGELMEALDSYPDSKRILLNGYTIYQSDCADDMTDEQMDSLVADLSDEDVHLDRFDIYNGALEAIFNRG